MFAVGGLIWIDTKAAAVTVNAAEPVIPPTVALILAVPIAALFARPVVGFTVAVPGVSEAQLALAVRSWVLSSVKVPVAVNCCVVPKAMLGDRGATAIETSTAALTVKVVPPLIELTVAVIFAVPAPTLVARPGVVVASLLMLATEGVSELHCAVLVTF
jgi:hypothetical protein